jgi:acyl carrier protein
MTVVSRSVEDDLREMLEQQLGRPVELNSDTRIVDDLELDSLAVMNFVMAVEDRYDISIPLDRIAEVETVADLVATVERLRQEH